MYHFMYTTHTENNCQNKILPAGSEENSKDVRICRVSVTLYTTIITLFGQHHRYVQTTIDGKNVLTTNLLNKYQP